MRLIFLVCVFALSANAQQKFDIENKIRITAEREGLDPDLAVAIATVESGMNPRAVGALNEQGLFQLRPEFHRLTGTLENNVQTGIKYLIQIKNSSGLGSAWFVSYNYGPNRKIKDPARTRYFKKVMNEISKIKVNRYLLASQ